MPETRGNQQDLLLELYRGAADSTLWPRFLSLLAGAFKANSAALRLIDACSPVVHDSFTVGFQEGLSRRYAEELVIIDPFREPLSLSPPGTILLSHEIISDRLFERSEHYQAMFRPNGNFYAMGAHAARG